MPSKTSAKTLNAQNQITGEKVVVRKKSNEISTPSISQALSGKFSEEKVKKVIVPKKYAEATKQIDEPFTENDLNAVWPQLLEKYHNEVHLYNSLDTTPKLSDRNVVVIAVENSVLQDKVRLIKPEIIGYLRRSLKNSTIDVRVELLKASQSPKILTDEQRLKAMINKNPALSLLKNKFNLDFNN